ncbi:MAG: hypothetical protein R3A47_01780 [Polyangiales bacterium]
MYPANLRASDAQFGIAAALWPRKDAAIVELAATIVSPDGDINAQTVLADDHDKAALRIVDRWLAQLNKAPAQLPTTQPLKQKPPRKQRKNIGLAVKLIMLMTIGAGSAITGGVLLSKSGKCLVADANGCTFRKDNEQDDGAALVGVGAAAVTGGVIWLIVNKRKQCGCSGCNHPSFGALVIWRNFERNFKNEESSWCTYIAIFVAVLFAFPVSSCGDSGGAAVPCENSSTCPAPSSFCDSSFNGCRSCELDTECTGRSEGAVCNVTTGQCVACSADNTAACNTIDAARCDTDTNSRTWLR